MSVETETRAEAPRRPKASTRAGTSEPRPGTGALAPPPLPGRRNPKWIALGVVTLCLGALLSYALYARLADQTPVVVVVNTVHRGDTVRASDLTTVTLPASQQIRAVPGDQLDQLLGRRAVYDLVAGSLLPVGAVADVVLPAAGRAVVGVRLVSGRVPDGLLPSGTPLRLVALPPTGTGAATPDGYTGQTIIARTVSKVDGTDGTSVVLNVDVPAATAPEVALLAAQERIAVVRDADR